jgi:phosphate transport system substrate-binding protein
LIKKLIEKKVLLPILIIAAIFFVAGCGADTSATGTVTESGSTTVQPLAEKWASEFMKKYPKINVTIQGGGSGVGIKAANDGTVDIGAASREMTADDPTLVKHLLCRDAIAVIVPPSSKLSTITKQQIIDIFSGKITNWSQLGGDNKDIHVVSREEGSGTRTAFQDMLLGKALMVNTAILQSSNGAIKTTVIGDPQAIGYLSLGYLDKTVKPLAVDGVECTAENAKAGKYPIVRPLYFLTKSQPAGAVKQFIDFCTGSEGQKVVVEEGYLPIN